MSRLNPPPKGAVNEIGSDERAQVRSQEIDLFSRLTWAGSALAAFTLLSGPNSVLPIPLPPSAPAWTPQGTTPQAPTAQSNPFSSLFSTRLFDCISHLESSGSKRGQTLRFKELSRGFIAAAREYDFDKAIAYLVEMTREIEFLPEHLQVFAVEKVARRADRLATKVLTILAEEGFNPISQHAAALFRGLLERLKHPASPSIAALAA